MIITKSIKLSWQNPGVYLCKDTEGKKCSVYNSSQSRLADGFEDNVTLIKFKDSGDIKYGAVLHEGRDYKGACNVYFKGGETPPSPPNGIVSLPAGKPSSITTFLQADKDAAGNYKIEPGSEVMLCKNTECQYAECFMDSNPCNGFDDRTSPPTKISEGASVILRYGIPGLELLHSRPQGIYYSPTGDGKFSDFSGRTVAGSTKLKWQNPNIPDDDINDKVNAIKIKGNLKVALFGNSNFEKDCEVLQTDYDPNLDTKTGNNVGNAVSSLWIIPVKK